MQVVLIVLAIFFAIWVIVAYKWFFITAAILAAAGYIGYRVYKAKKAKSPDTTAAEPVAKGEPAATASDAAKIAEPEPTDKITPYELKGVFACEKDIFRDLMELNPAYDWKKRELIDAYMTDYPVYKWVPKQLPAMLVPEPDNQYAPNAIKVVVGETTIGYIPKGKTGDVQKILDEGRLMNLAYEITGGKYKLVTEDYDPDKDKSTYDMESGYEEIAAKVYIKERL